MTDTTTHTASSITASSRKSLSSLQDILADARANTTIVPEIIVVLPAYNEGEALVTFLWEMEQVLRAHPFRLLVVDDGSTDNSMPLVKEANFEHVELIQHPRNRGLGEALKTGFARALEHSRQDGDVIIVLDSDSTHTPSLIERMIGRIKEGNDVVIASRYQYGSRVVGLSALRLLMSHGSSWVCRVMSPIPNVKDYTCGYRAYRAGILRTAYAKYGENFISESGFSCMVDVLTKLHKVKAIMSEIPLILRYDRKVSTSKMKIMKTVMNLMSLLVRRPFQR